MSTARTHRLVLEELKTANPPLANVFGINGIHKDVTLGEQGSLGGVSYTEDEAKKFVATLTDLTTKTFRVENIEAVLESLYAAKPNRLLHLNSGPFVDTKPIIALIARAIFAEVQYQRIEKDLKSLLQLDAKEEISPTISQNIKQSLRNLHEAAPLEIDTLINSLNDPNQTRAEVAKNLHALGLIPSAKEDEPLARKHFATFQSENMEAAVANLPSTARYLQEALQNPAWKKDIDKYFQTLGSTMPTADELQIELAKENSADGIRKVFAQKLGITDANLTDANFPLLSQVRGEAVKARLFATAPTELKTALTNIYHRVSLFNDVTIPMPKIKDLQSYIARVTSKDGIRSVFRNTLGLQNDELIKNGFDDKDDLLPKLKSEAAFAQLNDAPKLRDLLQNPTYTKEFKELLSSIGRIDSTFPDVVKIQAGLANATTVDQIKHSLSFSLGLGEIALKRDFDTPPYPIRGEAVIARLTSSVDTLPTILKSILLDKDFQTEAALFFSMPNKVLDVTTIEKELAGKTSDEIKAFFTDKFGIKSNAMLERISKDLLPLRIDATISRFTAELTKLPDSILRNILTDPACEKEIETYLANPDHRLPEFDELHFELGAATTKKEMREVLFQRLGLEKTLGDEKTPGPLADNKNFDLLHAEAISNRFSDIAINFNSKYMTTLQGVLTNASSELQEVFASLDAKTNTYRAAPELNALQDALAATDSLSGVQSALSDKLGLPKDSPLFKAGSLLADAKRGQLGPLRGEAAHAVLVRLAPSELHKVLIDNNFKTDIQEAFSNPTKKVPSLTELQLALTDPKVSTPDAIRTVLNDKLGTPKTVPSATAPGIDDAQLKRIYGEARRAQLANSAALTIVLPGAPTPLTLTTLKEILGKIATNAASSNDVITHLSDPMVLPKFKALQADIITAQGDTVKIKAAFTKQFGIKNLDAIITDDLAKKLSGEVRYINFMQTTNQNLKPRPLTAITILLKDPNVKALLMEIFANPAYITPTEEEMLELYKKLGDRESNDAKGMRDDITSTFKTPDDKLGTAVDAFFAQPDPKKPTDTTGNVRAVFGGAQLLKAHREAMNQMAMGRFRGSSTSLSLADIIVNKDPATYEAKAGETVTKLLRSHFDRLNKQQVEEAKKRLRGMTPEALEAFEAWKAVSDTSTNLASAKYKAYEHASDLAIRSALDREKGALPEEIAQLKTLNQREHNRCLYINLIQNRYVAESLIWRGTTLGNDTLSYEETRKAIEEFNTDMTHMSAMDAVSEGDIIKESTLALVNQLQKKLRGVAIPDANNPFFHAGYLVDDQKEANRLRKRFNNNPELLKLMAQQNLTLIAGDEKDEAFKTKISAVTNFDWKKGTHAQFSEALKAIVVEKDKVYLPQTTFESLNALQQMQSAQLGGQEKMINDAKIFRGHLDENRGGLSIIIENTTKGIIGYKHDETARNNITKAFDIHNKLAPQIDEQIIQLDAHYARLRAAQKLYAELVGTKQSGFEKMKAAVSTKPIEGTQFDSDQVLQNIQKKYPTWTSEQRYELRTELKKMHANGLEKETAAIYKTRAEYEILQTNLASLKKLIVDAKGLKSDQHKSFHFGKTTTTLETDDKDNVIKINNQSVDAKNIKSTTDTIAETIEKHNALENKRKGEDATGKTPAVSTSITSPDSHHTQKLSKNIVTVSTLSTPSGNAHMVGKINKATNTPEVTTFLDFKSSKGDDLQNIATVLLEGIRRKDGKLATNTFSSTRYLDCIQGDETAFFERCYAFARKYKATSTGGFAFSEACFKAFLEHERADGNIMLSDRAMTGRSLNGFASELASIYKEYIRGNDAFFKHLAVNAVEEQRMLLREMKSMTPGAPLPNARIQIGATFIPEVAQHMLNYCGAQGYGVSYGGQWENLKKPDAATNKKTLADKEMRVPDAKTANFAEDISDVKKQAYQGAANLEDIPRKTR